MSQGSRVLAIIPARGGSKGIPRKNLLKVAGRPLVALTIEQARASSRVTRVVVSTDDEEIAAVSHRAGAEVILRPAEISDDTATSESALLHALDVLSGRGYEPDLVVFLQVTSPLRRPEDIDAAIQTLEQEQADSLFSACPVHGFVWRRGPDRNWKSFTYDHAHRPRRQDAAEDVIENGSIYVFRPAVLLSTGCRLGGRIAVYPMSYVDSLQVDDPEDVRSVTWLMPRLGAPVRGDQLRGVRLLVMDCDGVLTDDQVLVDEHGKESVAFSRADGFGLARLREAGVNLAVLSKETNPVVSARCEKLNIPCLQGLDDKLPRLIELAREMRCESSQVAYVGNDLNDIECLQWVGIPIAVANAVEEVRAAAMVVTQRPGGGHAVREVCDLILKAKEENGHVRTRSAGQSSGR